MATAVAIASKRRCRFFISLCFGFVLDFASVVCFLVASEQREFVDMRDSGAGECERGKKTEGDVP